MLDRSIHARFSFGLKILTAAILAVAANVMFFDKSFGSTVGVFALLWASGLAVAVPGIRRSRAAMIALAVAGLLALQMIDDPGFLGWCLFWAALSSAVLLARRDFSNALELFVRVGIQAVVGLGACLRDAVRMLRLPRPDFRSSLLAMAAALALPLAGGVIFVALFASANPIVESLLPSLPSIDGIWIGRAVFTVLVFALAWPSLRPAHAATRWRLSVAGRPLNLPGVTALSITLSLFLFNAIFAVENVLDIVFLWSGAPLPKGVTMAGYAHRGAYPLIATALLAGAFVLITARPDTEIGRRPLIRWLVAAWIGQNLILVASSITRTLDYIDAYMLTSLRVAALVWMGLVAAGLVLICWRMMARRSLTWLINRIAFCAVTVLVFACIVDFGTVAADWNLRHAREAGGTGQWVDLYYLRSLGASALVPLAEADQRPLDGKFLNRLAAIREDIAQGVVKRQEEPYGWTWRNARRLAAVKAIHPRVYVPSNYNVYTGVPFETARPLTPPASQ